MDLNQYEYDKDLAEKGKKIDLGDGSYMVIARWHNKAFNELFTKRLNPAGKFVTKIAAEDQAQIMREVIADTILLDWGGIFDGDTEVPYTRQNVINMLTKYDSFAQDVMDMSKEDATFRAEALEADLGNSDPPSNSGSEPAENIPAP